MKRIQLLERVAIGLVALMALLQGFYAIYSFVEPSSFATFRGTALFNLQDTDWVQIYASRTLFVALIVGYLLLNKSYKTLVFAALVGCVMPITDAYLAIAAQASTKVVFKHVATLVYLLVTAVVLWLVSRNNK